MSTISSADGHCQQRKLKEQWGLSRDPGILSMIFAFSQHKIRISTFPALSPFSSLSLPVRVNAKSIWENRLFAQLPHFLQSNFQFSLLTVTIGRWNRRHSVSNRFVDSGVLVPCPYLLMRRESRIVSFFSALILVLCKLSVSQCSPHEKV